MHLFQENLNSTYDVEPQEPLNSTYTKGDLNSTYTKDEAAAASKSVKVGHFVSEKVILDLNT